MCFGDLYTDGLIKNYIESFIFKFDIVVQYILCFPHSLYVPYMFIVMKTIKTLTLCIDTYFSVTCFVCLFLFQFLSFSLPPSDVYQGILRFPGSVVKNLPTNEGGAGDVGSVSGLVRSPGEGHGNGSSILAWRIPWTENPGCATVHGVTKSRTLLSG